MTSHSDPAAELIPLGRGQYHPTSVCRQALGYLGGVESERLSEYQRESLRLAVERIQAVVAWLAKVEVRQPRQDWPVSTTTWTGD